MTAISSAYFAVTLQLLPPELVTTARYAADLVVCAPAAAFGTCNNAAKDDDDEDDDEDDEDGTGDAGAAADAACGP